MSEDFTHLNHAGEVHMVSVGHKEETSRLAVAEGYLVGSPEILAKVAEGKTPKGDILAGARVAAIMAAKRTSEWIPLCHPIPLTAVTIEIFHEHDRLRIQATTRTRAVTGVEMEALTAVSAGLLTMYDMLKGMDRTLTMTDIRLLQKSGGASGNFKREVR